MHSGERRFAIWDQINPRDGLSSADVLEQHLAEVRLAEELGYDEYWFSEHVFNPEYSLTAAPAVLLAAASRETRRITLGTMVHVLPLQDPLRLAAECATLDQLLRGRFCIGIGRGARGDEYLHNDVAVAESRARFQEAADLLTRLLSEEQVTHDGPYYRCRAATLSPRPFQQPHPPIVLASTSEESMNWAAERGLALARAHEPTEDLARARGYYDAAYRAAGFPGQADLRIMRWVYLADTDEQAREEAQPWLYRWLKLFSDSAADDQPSDEGFRALTGRLGRRTFDEMIACDMALVGSSASVTLQTRRLFEQGGINALLATFGFGGMPQERVVRNTRRFAQEVIPAVRRGTSGASVTSRGD